MAVPHWVLFPAQARAPSDFLVAAGTALRDRNCRPRELSELVRDPDTKAWDPSNNGVPCTQETAAVAIAKDWEGFVLEYEAKAIRDNVFLYVWKEGEKWGLSLEVTSSALYSEASGGTAGQWLEETIVAVTAALGVEASYFGFEAGMCKTLNVADLRERLRGGTIVKGHNPVFALLAAKLISEADTKSVLKSAPEEAKLRHFTIGEAYHAFSNLKRQS